MWVLAAVVAGFSLIQSIFGVGLLLFGTPTLLLLGYSFDQSLLFLLPCSITVNCLQVLAGRRDIALGRAFLSSCLPGVVVGLCAALQMERVFNLRLGVGFLLLMTAGIRNWPRLREAVRAQLVRFSKLSLVIVGLVHGLTNMGGGLLTLFVSTLFTDKAAMRSNVAFGYLLMAGCQLLVLLFLGGGHFQRSALLLPILAGAVYLVVGNRIFLAASEQGFQAILTVFIVIFGVMLISS